MSFTEIARGWGDRIRALRTDRGLSLEALASTAGLHYSHLSRLEHGQASVNDETRLRIATALGVRVEDIWTYPDTSEPATATAREAS